MIYPKGMATFKKKKSEKRPTFGGGSESNFCIEELGCDNVTLPMDGERAMLGTDDTI